MNRDGRKSKKPKNFGYASNLKLELVPRFVCKFNQGEPRWLEFCSFLFSQ